MTVYAVVVSISLVLLSLVGSRVALGYAVGVLAVTSLVLYYSYRAYTGRSKREIPNHRRRLDRFALGQWLSSSLIGLLALGVPAFFGWGTLGASRTVEALVAGVAIGSLSVFLSSLVDWYWVLPRVSGIVCDAPCEKAGGQRWALLTGIWLFHRAVATVIVCGVATGLILYIGAGTSEDAELAWRIAAIVVGAAILAFNNAALIALWYAFNPPRHVGDSLKIDTMLGHIVDVSLQGAKYKLLQGDSYKGEPFSDKADDLVSLWDLRHRRRASDSPSPCAERCSGVNWYCRHNPEAHC